MTLNQLIYAIAVSKENSMNEAAKKLFISQPSLTGAMHALENELGFDIFIRSKNGSSLRKRLSKERCIFLGATIILLIYLL